MVRRFVVAMGIATLLAGGDALAGYVKGVDVRYPFSNATVTSTIEEEGEDPVEERVWYDWAPDGPSFRIERYRIFPDGERDLLLVVEGGPWGTTIHDYVNGTSFNGPVLAPWEVDPYLAGDLPAALRGYVSGAATHLGRVCSIVNINGADADYRCWLWGPIPLRVEIIPVRRSHRPRLIRRALVIDVDLPRPPVWVQPVVPPRPILVPPVRPRPRPLLPPVPAPWRVK